MSPASTSSRRRRRQGGGRVHPLVIALVTILLIVFVTFYAFNQGLPFVHKYTLYALVNNSVNVRADSPVRIAGIDVGAVQGTEPAGQATKVIFTMDDAGLPVHTDATLAIRDRLFLEGGYYLALDPGSPSAPMAHDGFEIPLTHTSSPVQFYQVLSTFNAASRASLKHLLTTINQGFSVQPGQPVAASGAAGLKAAIPQLEPTLKDVAWVSQALRGTQPGDVGRLLSSGSAVTSTLSANDSSLVSLVHGLNLTSTALAATDGALAQTITGIDDTLKIAPGALSEIDHALPPTVALGRALDPSLKVAPPIVSSVTAAVQQLSGIVAQPERGRLLTSLKATFVQFPAIQRLLASSFPVTKAATDCLQTHVIPLLGSQVPDGSLSTGRPVWQDFVHFLPNIAGASGNFDANGYYTRVLAGAGTNSLSGGTLGSTPLLGQIVGAAPPGGTSILGARPAWVGTLTPSVFRPDVPCSTQKLPSLAAPAAAADLHSARSSAVAPMTRRQLLAAIARRQAKIAKAAKP